MTDPSPTHERRERAPVLRYAVAGGIALFVFLIGYFFAFGPLDPQEPAYRPEGANLELENKAAPAPQPKTP